MHLPAAPTPDRISEIQSALARGGYYKGDPNGKWDSDTVAAMQKFQSANGLDSTGKLDAPTLQKLGLGSDIAGVSAPKPIVPKCCSTPSTSTAPAPPADKPVPAAQTLAPAESATTASNTASATAASDPKAPQH
jgi:peptidoglycan hydrolase-like protein with peptidoglycan-binding domain